MSFVHREGLQGRHGNQDHQRHGQAAGGLAQPEPYDQRRRCGHFQGETFDPMVGVTANGVERLRLRRRRRRK